MEFEPKVFRTILFVRHGQYHREPEVLTAVGRRQSLRIAHAIAALRPTKIWSSTMPRAEQTAAVIAKQVGRRVVKSDEFREGLLPGTAEFHRAMRAGLSKDEVKGFATQTRRAQASADRAFRKLLQRPKSGQSTEVVVAHGNVIRYWVCRALDIPGDRWLKMDVANASITTIRISKSGKIMLLGFADIGHLPLKLRTYV